MKLIYLSVPYSHPDPAVREFRYRSSNAMAAYIKREGHAVFAPISQWHVIARDHDLYLDWDEWEEHDRVVLSRCDENHVLTLEGWTISRGVTKEIQIANELGIPVVYRAPVMVSRFLHAGIN